MNPIALKAPYNGETDDIARVLRVGGGIVCLGSFALLVLLVLFRPDDAAYRVVAALAVNILAGVAATLAARQGYLKAAMALISLSLITVTAVGVLGVGYGLKSSGFTLYITVICATALFFGSRAGWFATGFGLFLLVGTYAIEKTNPALAPHAGRQGTVLTSYAAVLLLLLVVFIITRAFLRRHSDTQQALIKESESLEEALRQREQANRESDEFFASLSHAIRTPMVGIQSGLQLLKDDRIPSDRRDVYLRSLRRSAQELESFVQTLLDFRASRRGLLATDLKPCDLGRFMEGLYAGFKAAEPHKNLRWSFQVEDAQHVRVLVDEKRLHQVLSILLTNAVKYARPGDSISLSALPLDIDDDVVAWSFTVTDTGPGIDENTLNRIFQPFIQSAADAANQTSGTGIGLALAHELSLLMGGNLQVSSEVGRGSRFWLVLPLQRAMHESMR